MGAGPRYLRWPSYLSLEQDRQDALCQGRGDVSTQRPGKIQGYDYSESVLL